MGEEKVFKHGDTIAIGTIPSGFIVLDKKKWEEERKRMEYELDVANERTNSWCAEYHKQKERAEKAEKELEELKKQNVAVSYEVPDPFSPENLAEAIGRVDRYAELLRELETTYTTDTGLINKPPPGSPYNIGSSWATRALLYYLVKKGVL